MTIDKSTTDSPSCCVLSNRTSALINRTHALERNKPKSFNITCKTRIDETPAAKVINILY
jgi:hypothetical protein